MERGPGWQDKRFAAKDKARSSQVANRAFYSVALGEVVGVGDDLAAEVVEGQMDGPVRQNLREDDGLVAEVLGLGRGRLGGALARRVLISHEEVVLLVVRPPVGVPPPAGGCLLFDSPRLPALESRTLQSPSLPSNDLADASVMQPDLVTDGTQRESLFLGLSECLAPRLLGGRRIAVKLLLRSLYGTAGPFFSIDRHRGSLISRG
jgi:hypothetical protein